MQYSENAKLVKLIVGNQDDASAKQKKQLEKQQLQLKIPQK